PSLILQPLAENAVVHGVAADADLVSVTITARRKADKLELQVRNSASARPRQDAQLGIGLANTRERLDALFGPHHSLDLRREGSGAVVARLEMPFIAHAPEGAA